MNAIKEDPRVWGILRNINWQLATDVSAQIISTIFKGQTDGTDGDFAEISAIK